MKLKIGENIRNYRTAAKITQQQLADVLGVSYQSVSRWENNETYPDMELLPAIAEMFSVTLDELVGMSYEIKEKNARKAVDDLRCASMKKEIIPDELIPIIRDIRRNYIGNSAALSLWSYGNNRAYCNPYVLPEIRMTAEKFLELHPNNAAAIRTMAEVEDDEHIDEFLKKYAASFDVSKRALLYTRYLKRCDREKFEFERQFRFFISMDYLLDKHNLIAWDKDENFQVTNFQSALLNIVRNNVADNNPDIWTECRLELGFKNAAQNAVSEKITEAFDFLQKSVELLEKTMEITDNIQLKTSCSWLESMIWEAEESWENPYNDPIGFKEREIFIYTYLPNNSLICYLITPSRYYSYLSWAEFDSIRNTAEFNALSERIKKLIIRHNPKDE